MIKVTNENTFEYFTKDVVDEIFNVIHDTIRPKIGFLPPLAIGCMCFPSVPTKVGHKNVFVEYTSEREGNINTPNSKFSVKVNSVIIYDGNPDEIQKRVDEIKEIISLYAIRN